MIPPYYILRIVQLNNKLFMIQIQNQYLTCNNSLFSSGVCSNFACMRLCCVDTLVLPMSHMYTGPTCTRVHTVHVCSDQCVRCEAPLLTGPLSRGWSSAGAEVGREVRHAERWPGHQNTGGAPVHTCSYLPLHHPATITLTCLTLARMCQAEISTRCLSNISSPIFSVSRI